MAARTDEWKWIVEDQKNSELSVEKDCRAYHGSPGAYCRRKSVNGLALIVGEFFGMNVMDRSMFIFTSRR